MSKLLVCLEAEVDQRVDQTEDTLLWISPHVKSGSVVSFGLTSDVNQINQRPGQDGFTLR